MKKNTTVIGLCVVFIIVCLSAAFWFSRSSQTDHMTFLPTQGEFTTRPAATLSDNIYTVTWSTSSNYTSNEVVLKQDGALYPEFGVGADSEYDATNNSYVHTAQFRLTADGQRSDVPLFEAGTYTYQVKSLNNTNTDAVISVVEAL